MNLEKFLDQDRYQTNPMKHAEFGKAPDMQNENVHHEDDFGGLSLDTILESRASFERGEGIPFEKAKRDVLKTLE